MGVHGLRFYFSKKGNKHSVLLPCGLDSSLVLLFITISYGELYTLIWINLGCILYRMGESKTLAKRSTVQMCYKSPNFFDPILKMTTNAQSFGLVLIIVDILTACTGTWKAA